MNNIIGVVIVVVIFSIFLIGTLFPGKIGASEGTHAGIVTAVEHNSNIIWESDLVYFKTSEESTQEDVYCVNNTEIKKQLTNETKIRREVFISYRNNFFMWKWQCNGGQSIIYEVQPLEF